MSGTVSIAESRLIQVATSTILVTLWMLFAIAHFSKFQSTGKISLLAFGTAETLIAIFFLLRTQPKTFTMNAGEWVVALVGTFLPLLLRPTANSLIAMAEMGVLIGATLQIAGVLSLNRSFALVPALRELKTRGMYGVVRHPIYLSYVISLSCYAVANFSMQNLLVVVVSICLLVGRIFFEEKHLSVSHEYRAYQQRTRWRLIPFLF